MDPNQIMNMQMDPNMLMTMQYMNQMNQMGMNPMAFGNQMTPNNSNFSNMGPK